MCSIVGHRWSRTLRAPTTRAQHKRTRIIQHADSNLSFWRETKLERDLAHLAHKILQSWYPHLKNTQYLESSVVTPRGCCGRRGGYGTAVRRAGSYGWRGSAGCSATTRRTRAEVDSTSADTVTEMAIAACS